MIKGNRICIAVFAPAAHPSSEGFTHYPVASCIIGSPYPRRPGRLAQLVEHLVYTEGVGGSSPSPPISARPLGKPFR